MPHYSCSIPHMNIPTLVKRPLRSLISSLGYDVFKVRPGSVPGSPLHEVIRPRTTYLPWNEDETFMETYQTIQEHTLVDRYRCFELWSLVEQASKIKGSLIEIGVWRGGTGALIARKANLCGTSDPVYLCDTFTGVVKASGKDSTYEGGEHSDTSLQTVQSLLDGYRLDNVRILEGIFPDETLRFVEQESFRFCHIDVDVYQSAKEIVEWIWPKLSIGGMIVYDDYGFIDCDGITEHVEEQRSSSDRLLMYNLNGHAVIVKI